MIQYLFGVIVALITMFYFNRHSNKEYHTPLCDAVLLSLASWIVVLGLFGKVFKDSLSSSKLSRWFENKH